MNKLTLLLLTLSISHLLSAQQYLDYQLRLEPVWSRVADALGEAGSVESAEFSPDGKHIVSGTKYDNSVVMWRTSDGAELWRQYTAQEVERVGWSADGQYVAACSEDFLVTVYDSKTGEIVKKIEHEQGIDGLTWSNSSSILVTGEEMTYTEDGTKEGWLRVFEMPSGKEIKKINYGSTTNEVFFSHDDKHLLAAGHVGVKIYDTKTWKLVKELDTGDDKASFVSAVFSPDSKYVLGAGNVKGIKGNLYIWELESGKLKRKFNHTGRKVESVSWHPNGKYIVHVGHTPYVHVYRVEDVLEYKGDAIPEAHLSWSSDHAEYIDFNADGSFVVSAHQNGLIKLWAWMGEDPNLNKNRHKWVKTKQTPPSKNQ